MALNKCIQICTFLILLYQQIKQCWTISELVIDLYPEIIAEMSFSLQLLALLYVLPLNKFSITRRMKNTEVFKKLKQG